LLMLADSRCRRPAPLKGQQAHHEDEEVATHWRASLTAEAAQACLYRPLKPRSLPTRLAKLRLPMQ
jgi:hypothetical protein